MTIKNNFIFRTLLLFLCFASCTPSPDKYKEWKVYGGTKEGIRYSSLSQIDTSNVHQLKIAWVYHTGDTDSLSGTQIQCNPIIVNGILYATSPKLKLFSLDAATGKQKWVFDPLDTQKKPAVMINVPNTNRGVSYWTDGKNDKRIFYASGKDLICVNAVTGKPESSFGNNGRIDLHAGLGWKDTDFSITYNTPGIIFRDLLIIGSIVSEGADAGPGHIRAYDVRTGEQKWIFHTIPWPGEFGFNTWDDSTAYRNIGGANNWSGMSLDEKRGIVFIPTGSASFDFYGGKRTGENLFANCVIALDAVTGKRIWHFQTVHHDLWDRDLPSPPALVTITRNGRKIDALAQPTKTGMLFLLDRETGQPLYPVKETPVPVQTELAGEKVYQTQPIPSLPKPFVRQTLSESDLNNLVDDSSYQDIKKRLAGYRTGNMFNPPSKQGTIIFPGYDGGAEWGGPSFDPGTGILYINASEMAWVLTMVDVNYVHQENETFLEAGKRLYKEDCMTCHGPDRKGSDHFPDLTAVNKKYNENMFVQLLSSGRGRMPSFGHLKEEEKNAIATFILGLKNNYVKKFGNRTEMVNPYTQLPYATTGYNKFLTRKGYPAVKPPWGTLNAINLNSGQLIWKSVLGEHPYYKSKNLQTGTENYGGPVVTAGGLLFIAATPDGKIRAFNKRNGKMLWEYKLPSPGFATPSVYAVNGKQYVVIACGGGKLGTKSGDAYVAFTLPESKR
jgi:quinoprotein glucose dehydrogenase